MSKFIKNNKGFTLVEVIVVAVIVLILAAVAIPLYQGYIKDSRASVAESTAAAVASLLSAANQSQMAGKDVTVTTTANPAGVRVTVVNNGVAANTDGSDYTDIVMPKNYCVEVNAANTHVVGKALSGDGKTIIVESPEVMFASSGWADAADATTCSGDS